MLNKSKEILITGSAGFIGYHLANYYLSKKYTVTGVDNFSSYYRFDLKKRKILLLKKKYKNFTFHKVDISNFSKLKKIFNHHKFNLVINLAAQPGVRSSIINPKYVFKQNITGFFNILNLVREFNVDHLIYASTSSVYGNSKKRKFKEIDINNTPLQMYSASKITNEILAYSYSNIYKIKITGLRFFTVYGPFGRPDMAYYKFTNKIFNNKKINIYNYGNHKRDFTFIDDIVRGIYNASKIMPNFYKQNFTKVSHEIFNLGSGKQFHLKEMISILEKLLKKNNKAINLPHQIGDMQNTFSDINKAKTILNYKPTVGLEQGLKSFIKWYLNYYK